jgi:hypothetical protein
MGRLTAYGNLLALRSDNGRVQMHGLKVFALVPIGNRKVQAADFRRKGESPGPAADHAGTQFLAVLHHEQTVVRQTPDDAVGPVDDQRRQVLELFQQIGVGVIGNPGILQAG